MRHSLFHWGCLPALVLLVLGLSGPVRPSQAQNNTDMYVANEVLVKLFLTTDLPGVINDIGGLDGVNFDQFGTRPIYRLRITDGNPPDDKAEELRSHPRVQFAEPNYLGQTPEGRMRASWAVGGESSDFTTQWAPYKIRLDEAHTKTRGQGIIVAVLDTGIDRNHPVFANTTVLPGYDFVNADNNPSEVGSKDQSITYGHGTHVAGLIALSAPAAKIMPVRILDEHGVGNIWVLIEGLKYAVNNGAHVINLSMSYTRESHILEDIVTRVAGDDDDCEVGGKDLADDDDLCVPKGGVVVITAAGNSGSQQPEYPAAEQATGSLAVAASTRNDSLASFSNYGQWVDLAAPGEAILSSVPNDEYGSWSGTSMATPLVAGTAALVRAQHPFWTSTQVVNQITKTATQTNALVPRRLDAASAVGVSLPPNVVRVPMVLR